MGAVFLPVAGTCYGTSASGGSGGIYWSASRKNSKYAYRVSFDGSHLYASDTWYRYFGLSVRLVRPAHAAH